MGSSEQVEGFKSEITLIIISLSTGVKDCEVFLTCVVLSRVFWDTVWFMLFMIIVDLLYNAQQIHCTLLLYFLPIRLLSDFCLIFITDTGVLLQNKTIMTFI